MPRQDMTSEALAAFARALKAAASSDTRDAPRNSSRTSSTKLSEPVKAEVHADALSKGGMDPGDATELRIKKSEADKKDLENKRLEFDNEKIKLENRRLKGENKLRRRLGTAAIVFVAVQLGVCDIGFAAYVIYSIVKGWAIPNNVILGWMAASLVEIIGILWVIARSLFPFRDEHRDFEAERERVETPR